MMIHLTLARICLLLSSCGLYFRQFSRNKRQIERLNLRNDSFAPVEIAHVFLMDLLEVLAGRRTQGVLGLVDCLVLAEG